LDYSDFVTNAHAINAHAKGVKVVVATDLLSLTMLKPPGEFGADMAIGSAQRFGEVWGSNGIWRASCNFSGYFPRV